MASIETIKLLGGCIRFTLMGPLHPWQTDTVGLASRITGGLGLSGRAGQAFTCLFSVPLLITGLTGTGCCTGTGAVPVGAGDVGPGGEEGVEGVEGGLAAAVIVIGGEEGAVDDTAETLLLATAMC